jgi:hypothetical protein
MKPLVQTPVPPNKLKNIVKEMKNTFDRPSLE